MEFFKSFIPILKPLKKYLIEIVLISIASIIALVSLLIYLKSSSDVHEITKEPLSLIRTIPSSNKIFIDISGAVERPNVYEVITGSRLKDLINLAGGLSNEADKNFFSRNFNLAKIMIDQEKIYIPSTGEINSGVFVETQRTLDYNSPVLTSTKENNINDTNLVDEKININSATIEELDTLTGIGKVTAQKIIDNRPFKIIDELLTKKVLKKNIYDKIKDLVIIN